MHAILLILLLGVGPGASKRRGVYSARTASGSGEPMPVALPGLRMKPPIGQGWGESENVAVRGDERTHGHAGLSCHNAYK